MLKLIAFIAYEIWLIQKKFSVFLLASIKYKIKGLSLKNGSSFLYLSKKTDRIWVKSESSMKI
jgi:hypothetical protein